MRSKKLLYLTKIALMVALIAVMSQIVLPLGSVPMTLQTFSIAFCGYFLGAKFGTLAVITYLSAGAIGLPVFAGFGATASLIGMTGGFLFGFLPLVFFCGLAQEKKKGIFLLLSAIGILFCHIFGIVWFSVITENPLSSAFLLTSAPYLPKDMLSIFFAAFLAKKVKKHG